MQAEYSTASPAAAGRYHWRSQGIGHTVDIVSRDLVLWALLESPYPLGDVPFFWPLSEWAPATVVAEGAAGHPVAPCDSEGAESRDRFRGDEGFGEVGRDTEVARVADAHPLRRPAAG